MSPLQQRFCNIQIVIITNFVVVSSVSIKKVVCSFWLSLGLSTRQPLWVILCHLPEKGRKEIEEIVEEMKEGQRSKRNRNESEETGEIETFPLYPYLLQG